MTEQVDTVTCKFPGCQNPPESATDKPGRPPGYCADKAHNATTAWRERKRIAAAEHEEHRVYRVDPASSPTSPADAVGVPVRDPQGVPVGPGQSPR